MKSNELILNNSKENALLSIESECENQNFISEESIKNSFSKVNFIFNLRDNCNVNILLDNDDNKIPLIYFYLAFQNQLLNTENFMKEKYKDNKTKLKKIPKKLQMLKIATIYKLINEVFEDSRHLITNDLFGIDKDKDKDINKKKVSYMMRFLVPENEIEFVQSYFIKANDCELKDASISVIEKFKPEMFNSKATNKTNEDYKNILLEIFDKLDKVYLDVINMTNFDFFTFIKTICVFLMMTEQLFTKLKLIGNEVHIEIFTDEINFLKKAEKYKYCFKLSESGKLKLSSNYNGEEDLESLTNNNSLKQFYTKNIYLSYTKNSNSLFVNYNKETDCKVKSNMIELSNISILRNVDRIRLLEISLYNCLSIFKLKRFDIFKDLTVKRDFSIYKKNLK